MNAAAKRFFSVDEAQSRLPLVRSIVSDIVELYRDIHDRQSRLTRVLELRGESNREVGRLYTEELEQMEQELEDDLSRLDSFVEELESLGVELKDPYAGLVDFHTWINGREACLCWQLGEPEIQYWHEVDAGIGGRQSLQDGSVDPVHDFTGGDYFDEVL
ncbi:DUF2203 domain-containing protein [Thalassoroseus pseudoceratinae]|uniref:DUF2203 domain-containing protein n=1 Tax=Thalassoroseus pseudoceratinae TaxID=2713176 RepID=UPI00141D8F20|nr:DUF2203 domain-containing protein [Thalassoroseus pseudoceratinae]